MTALATERGANQQWCARLGFTLASGFKAWKGARIALDLATGKVRPAAILTTGTLLAIGFAHETVDATSADKELEVDLEREFMGRWLANSGTNAVAATDIGKLAYLEDDQTVGIKPLAGAPIAGRVWAVSATRGVLVEQDMAIEGRIIAALPAFAAGDSALPANPPDGAVIDIPTTAGVSTVTLPASAIEGTKVFFVADGTKNGHTIQYRDATGPVNLTTALLASKRHLAVAAFIGGKWAVNAYVAP